MVPTLGFLRPLATPTTDTLLDGGVAEVVPSQRPPDAGMTETLDITPVTPPAVRPLPSLREGWGGTLGRGVSDLLDHTGRGKDGDRNEVRGTTLVIFNPSFRRQNFLDLYERPRGCLTETLDPAQGNGDPNSRGWTFYPYYHSGGSFPTTLLIGFITTSVTVEFPVCAESKEIV